MADAGVIDAFVTTLCNLAFMRMIDATIREIVVKHGLLAAIVVVAASVVFYVAVLRNTVFVQRVFSFVGRVLAEVVYTLRMAVYACAVAAGVLAAVYLFACFVVSAHPALVNEMWGRMLTPVKYSLLWCCTR